MEKDSVKCFKDELVKNSVWCKNRRYRLFKPEPGSLIPLSLREWGRTG